jgi:hypothetical protein
MVELIFDIDGKQVLEPRNWKELTEVWEFGQNSNQPVISSEQFRFEGDGCKLIYDNFKTGNLLKPLSINGYYKQPKAQDFILKDYIIDGSIPPKFNGILFNGEINPSSVDVSIRKKDSLEDLQAELQGITWLLLEDEGYVDTGSYVTVPTAVMPLYNFVELGLAKLSILVITLQLEKMIQDAKDLIAETIKNFATADPVAVASSVVLLQIKLAFQLASFIILSALIINTFIDLLRVLLPPIVKNKAMTWRKGLDAIFGYLNLEYVCKFPEIEYEAILPSKPASNETNIFDGLFTKLVPNEKGYPNNDDFGYKANDYIEALKRRFNARLDFIAGKVYIREEDNDALFKQSQFKEKFDTNYETFEPNIDEIPNTRLFSFLYDSNDEYTTENKKGTFYEVKNISKDGYLPFKGLDRIDIPYALGNAKTKLVGIEKLLLQFAKIGDALLKFTGSKPTLVKKIKKNRVNVLKVSHNNYMVAKLLPLKNGQLTGQNRELLSAKVIENTYYKNRRLSENGQKLIYDNVTMPFNMQDREYVMLNGNFVNSLNQEATFRSLQYKWSNDTIQCDIEVRNKYLAKDSYEERFYEP